MTKTPLGVVAGCNIFMDCNLHNFFVQTPNLVFLGSLESLESVESRFLQKKTLEMIIKIEVTKFSNYSLLSSLLFFLQRPRVIT